jgi:hypothetical protein
MGPVLKVVEILDKARQGAKAGDATEGSDKLPATGSSPAGSAVASKQCPRLPKNGQVLTAATDPSRLRAGVATSGTGARIATCSQDAQCSAVRRGPFVVTDLQTAENCKVTVFSIDPLDDHPQPAWLVSGPLQVHGARLLVPAGSALVVGTAESETSCELLWAGFEPYGLSKRLPEDL